MLTLGYPILPFPFFPSHVMILIIKFIISGPESQLAAVKIGKGPNLLHTERELGFFFFPSFLFFLKEDNHTY